MNFKNNKTNNNEEFMRLISCNTYTKLRTRDENGNLPLHIYVGSYPIEESVFEFLIKNAPETVKERGRFGRLPLHYALCQKKVNNIKMLKALLNVYPEASNTFTNGGWIPLHYAVDRDNSQLDVVKILCEYYPDGPLVKDFDDKLAIHWAISRTDASKINIEVIRYLSRYDPASATSIATDRISGSNGLSLVKWSPIERALELDNSGNLFGYN
jgi:ankyrin repeat protein